MLGQRLHFLLPFIAAIAVLGSLAFNIDIQNKEIYGGKKEDFFGYKVLQFKSGTDKGIIVTAPLQHNGSGGVCRLFNNKDTHCFNSKDTSLKNSTILAKHLGLSIAADSTSSQITVCSPNVVHECNENQYLNSLCYKMTYKLRSISSFTPDFQACTKKTVDLVFLFDGSGSMTESEFTQNKYFIKDIMNNLKNTSIKFAAVQFSTVHRKVFDFNDYQAGRAFDKLTAEAHIQGLTNTHKALEFVLQRILEDPAAGASPDAIKVLVLITDGDPSDTDKEGIIKRYYDKNIIRFVIGVKDAKLEKFENISSVPTEKYAFKIEDYNGLTGILENFQNRIFKMEGSSMARAGDITGEMSQSGISAAFYKDKLILGAVGYNSWRGSLQEIHENGNSQIEDQHMQHDSYMGYSISMGEKNKVLLCFSGAPRYQHIGQVVLFKQDGKAWITAQRQLGDQIGSYFGAELCSADINSDGDTDFLLVGAPLFYQSQEKTEGQIYIYALTDEIELKSRLNVTAPFMGRFGTTISSLADLNGDGLRDVAVGAPLEDDSRGVVYIYLGDRHTGIRGTFSQRIIGENIMSGLRFFGQAIDGNMDLEEDGLPDIVIGSQGTTVVLRSRPVVNVTARLFFHPEKINTDQFNCVNSAGETLSMVNLTVCFEMVETTKSRAGAVNSKLNISYMFNVDPKRQTKRGFFETKDKSRTFHKTTSLGKDETCFNHTIYMPKCVKDTFSPLIVKLNFSQIDSESGNVILNMDSKRMAGVEVPFERQCVKNDTCISELEVDFNFTTTTLLVTANNYFNISVKLSNHGDDSYNTSLTMYYPPGLSFSRMSLIEASRPILHSCNDLNGELNKTICGISLPVYRSRSVATFISTFHIDNDYDWKDTLTVTIAGKSHSDKVNSTKNVLTKSIPVQFGIKMAVTVQEGSTPYLNFISEDVAPKKMQTVYKITNTGWRSFPVTPSLLFPTELGSGFKVEDYNISVQENKTQCKITNMTNECCLQEQYCKLIKCDPFTLDKGSFTEFILSANVHFSDLKVRAENMSFLKNYTGLTGEALFKSFIDVRYDEKLYVMEFHAQENKNGFTQKSREICSWKHNPWTVKWAEVLLEYIIPPNKQLIIATGVVLGLLLLLIIALIMLKLGCFKRKKFCENEEDVALQVPGLSNGHSNTTGKSEQFPEEEKLLNIGESNGDNIAEKVSSEFSPSPLPEEAHSVSLGTSIFEGFLCSSTARDVVKEVMCSQPEGDQILKEYQDTNCLSLVSKEKMVDMLVVDMVKSHGRSCQESKVSSMYALGIVTLFPNLKRPETENGYEDFYDSKSSSGLLVSRLEKFLQSSSKEIEEI